MVTDTRSPPTCFFCGSKAPQPLLICFECSEGTDVDGVISLTVYCGTACRLADSSSHKTDCDTKNDFKCLYRAGELLQAAFYEWRETGFDMKIAQVWKMGKVLCFQEQNYETGTSLYRFPNEMFPDSQDKKKMLSYAACTEAQGAMYELSKKLLQGWTMDLFELDMEIATSHLAIRRYFSWGPDTVKLRHQVLEVCLRGKHGFILDLAGVQNGQPRAVIPTPDYVSNHAVACIKRLKFGHEASLQTSEIKREIREGKHAIWRAGAEMRVRFKAAIDKWEASQSKTVQQLLRGSRRSYEEGKQVLLGNIHKALEEFVLKDMKTGKFKLDHDPGDTAEETSRLDSLCLGNDVFNTKPR